ncbi:Helix-turn-helix [uncultured archaeon]|nr:Helix-turn-helix [uncultured archaeon]
MVINECIKCGVSGDRIKLYHAVSDRGIVKICGDCNRRENLPIMKQPTDEQILESKSPGSKSVRDRLKSMQRNTFFGKEPTLREMVDRNLKSRMVQPPSDLVTNFHWTIQQIRRTRKITREQFAKGIGESEATVRMIEQGLIPNGDYKIINKIEAYLGISLRKSEKSGFPSAEPQRKFTLDNSLISKEEKEMAQKSLSFDADATKNLKISDLKEMKKKQGENFEEDIWNEEYSEDDEKYLDKQEEFDEEEDK